MGLNTVSAYSLASYSGRLCVFPPMGSGYYGTGSATAYYGYGPASAG